MVPPVHQESSVMPNNTLKEKEVELEEEKELSCTRKRPKCAGSVVQSQQEIEVLAIENVNKGPGFLSPEESAYVVQSNVEANVCSQGDIRGSTTQELAARAKLNDFCSAIGWKYPKYDFEEQGPNKNLFTCKATVHVDAITDTIVECFSESKPQKEAAREQAAQERFLPADTVLDPSQEQCLSCKNNLQGPWPDQHTRVIN